jgi:hypothetical protein
MGPIERDEGNMPMAVSFDYYRRVCFGGGQRLAGWPIGYAIRRERELWPPIIQGTQFAPFAAWLPVRGARPQSHRLMSCQTPIRSAIRQETYSSLVLSAPLGHEYDDMLIRVGRLKLFRCCIRHVADILRELNHRNLHSEANAQVRYRVDSCPARGRNHAFRAPVPKTPGYEDPLRSAQLMPGFVVFRRRRRQGLGLEVRCVDPNQIQAPGHCHACVLQAFDD